MTAQEPITEPKLFHGKSGGPDIIVDKAESGEWVIYLRGWLCGRCDKLHATKKAADDCCTKLETFTYEV